MPTLPREPGFDEIAAAGGDVVSMHDEPHPLCDGFFHGERGDRAGHPLRNGLVGHHSFRAEYAIATR